MQVLNVQVTVVYTYLDNVGVDIIISGGQQNYPRVIILNDIYVIIKILWTEFEGYMSNYIAYNNEVRFNKSVG